MSLSRKEIKTSALNATKQESAQIGDIVNEFINLTINQINYPGWAFPRQNSNHLWSWLRRKTTFPTVSGTADYVLDRDVDKIAILRQTDSPKKLDFVADQDFYNILPGASETGYPRIYRTWETEGVSTRLATAGLIDVLSSSSSDAGSSELSVTILGYVSGLLRRQVYQLNGTTAVAGTLTFQARELFVSKQKDTTGTITVRKNSDSSTLVVLSPTERAPRFKVASLYPTPSAVSTMYLEYYTRIPNLINDSDVALVPNEFHHVIRLGVIAKIYELLNKEDSALVMMEQFSSAVRAMVAADHAEPDVIEGIKSTKSLLPYIYQRRSTSAIS